MLVGGFVRDLIMNRAAASKDIDVEVYGLTFAALTEALGRAGRVDEVGKSYGVLKIRAGDTDLDVNVPRRERKIGAGHRGFDIIPDMNLDFREASARRDFTMNAILLDPEAGTVIDCHGGVDDIAAGILRHTSGAFAEDPLRVLRAVQFAARFGFRLAPETAVLCQSLAGSYSELPVERVWCEAEKIGTRGKHITAALTALEASGWERHFPQLTALHGIEQDPEWHPEGDVWVHSGLSADQAARLADEAGLTGADRFTVVTAALVHDFGKVTHTQRTAGRITSHGHAEAGVEPAQTFLRSAGCPEGLVSRIVPLVREHMNCNGRPAGAAVRRLARRLVPATMAELVMVCGADRAGRGDPDAPNPAAPWFAAAADLRVTERPAKGLLTGDHLIAAGMKPGPAFRPLLAAALEAQDAGEFEDEAGALRWLAAQGISGQMARWPDGQERMRSMTDYAEQAADFIAEAERIGRLNLPRLPGDPAEAAAMRAKGYDVLAEVTEVDGPVALVSVAAEDEDARHAVRAAELAGALGVPAEQLAGTEFIATMTETPETGPVLSAFRPVPAAAAGITATAPVTEFAVQCRLVFGDQAELVLAGGEEDDPMRWPAAKIAEETGLQIAELPGKRFRVRVAEEGGRVAFSGFRLAQ